MARISNLSLALAVIAALAVAASAAPKQQYRHYFFYAGAPASSATIRANLYTAYNKIATPGNKVLSYISSFADPADAKDPALAPKYPYNFGGYFQLASRDAWKAYDAWQKTQPIYNTTFAPIKDVARFHAYVPV